MGTFFRNGDYETYIDLVANACREAGTEVWAYCLMLNHYLCAFGDGSCK